MATGVYCKDCAHYAECKAAKKEYRIVVYVEGLVDCGGYEPNRKEKADGE